jgi:hypothetical protein
MIQSLRPAQIKVAGRPCLKNKRVVGTEQVVEHVQGPGFNPQHHKYKKTSILPPLHKPYFAVIKELMKRKIFIGEFQLINTKQ